MSSALKPALPPTGGQSSPSNAPAAKPLGPQTMAHSTPASYTQPLGHLPQSGMHMPMAPPNPASLATNMATNMSASLPTNMSAGVNQALAMGHPQLNQAAPMIPNAHISPNKNAVLPGGRPNMLPYMANMHSREEDSATLPPTQNAAQLLHRQEPFSKAQSNGTPGLEVCKPSVPTPQPQPQPQPPAADTRPEPPAPPTQNHVPVSHEAAKQPDPLPEKPAAVAAPPAPSPEKPVPVEEPRNSAGLVAAPAAPAPPAPPAAQAPASEPIVEPAQTAPSPMKLTIPKEAPKAPTTLKLATTPRTVTRKREVKPKATEKSEETPKSSPAKSDRSVTPQKTPSSSGSPSKSKGRVSDEERKSKRTRTRTQPYQSPIPELALITKLSNSSVSSKNNDEKLIVFYKNEFLAVRNAEGGFYVCQAVQNVYKSSPRIRIRWLSQDKNDKTYVPDFYDFTDFDCILTNLNMDRVEKGKYNLPKDELERTENILKRALAVESGDAAPSLTEEHPDGLDLSLFRDESQLKKKRKATKRKSSEPLTMDPSDEGRHKKSPVKSKVRKVAKTVKKAKKNNQAKEITNNSIDKKKKLRTDSGRAERAKRRQEASPANKTSPVVDQKKARVLAKVAMKTAISASQPKNQKKVKKPAAPSKAATAVPSSSKTKVTRSQAPPPPPPPTNTRRGKTNKK